MSTPSIVPLTITIMPRDDQPSFPVRVESGDARAEATLELPEQLIAMGERLLVPGVELDFPDLENVGRQLGRALFTPRVRGLMLEQARVAAQSQRRLQIQLQIAVPELAALPWEWLAIGVGRPWIPALREEYPLVRIGRRTPPQSPIVVDGPLRILAVGGVDQGDQLIELTAALAGAARERRVVVDRLADADLTSLTEVLSRRQYHILHLAAAVHLTADQDLVVELGRGEDAFALAELIADHATLRLITITGAVSDQPGLTATPAVLGAVLMGDRVPAAVSFSSGLPAALSARIAACMYDELAAGVAIDQAVTIARREVMDERPPAWGVAQLRTVPAAENLFVIRPGQPPVNARRLLPFALALLLLVAIVLVVRSFQQSQNDSPLEQRIPTTRPSQAPTGPGTPSVPMPTATTARPGSAALPQPQGYIAYTIALSDTLDTISARFGSDPQGIMALNVLNTPEVRPGRSLVVPVYQPAETATGGLVIDRGNLTTSMVAVTFDIERDQETLYSILEILAARSIKATFFLTGSWVEAYPDAARAIVRAGHELGNHSYTHPYFSRITAEGINSEIQQTEQRVRDTTGATTRPFFRFPYGDSTAASLTVVAQNGYIAYHWSTDEAGLQNWLAKVTADPASGHGAILLFHGRAETIAALPGWLDQISALGLHPTTLSETLR